MGACGGGWPVKLTSQAYIYSCPWASQVRQERAEQGPPAKPSCWSVAPSVAGRSFGTSGPMVGSGVDPGSSYRLGQNSEGHAATVLRIVWYKGSANTAPSVHLRLLTNKLALLELPAKPPLPTGG